MRETRELALLHVACRKQRETALLHRCKVQLHQLIACIFIYSTKWPYVKTMNAKNTKKWPIHENAGANITCDFGDGDISRSRSQFTHTHTHARIASSIIVRLYTRYSMLETRETALLHVACRNPTRRRYCMGAKFWAASAHRMHIHIFNKVAVCKNYECQKYEKNHQFMRMRTRTYPAILATVRSAVLWVGLHTHTHAHTHTRIASSIIVRLNLFLQMNHRKFSIVFSSGIFHHSALQFANDIIIHHVCCIWHPHSWGSRLNLLNISQIWTL